MYKERSGNMKKLISIILTIILLVCNSELIIASEIPDMKAIFDHVITKRPCYLHIHEEDLVNINFNSYPSTLKNAIHCTSGSKIGMLKTKQDGYKCGFITRSCIHGCSGGIDYKYQYQIVTESKCMSCEYEYTTAGNYQWGSWICSQ